MKRLFVPFLCLAFASFGLAKGFNVSNATSHDVELTVILYPNPTNTDGVASHTMTLPAQSKSLEPDEWSFKGKLPARIKTVVTVNGNEREQWWTQDQLPPAIVQDPKKATALFIVDEDGVSIVVEGDPRVIPISTAPARRNLILFASALSLAAILIVVVLLRRKAKSELPSKP